MGGHTFLEVVFEQPPADMVARAFVAEDIACGGALTGYHAAIVIAEVAASAQDAHHACIIATEGTTGP